MTRLRAFGIALETDWSFINHVTEDLENDSVDLRVAHLPENFPDYPLTDEKLIYKSPYKTIDGDSLVLIYRFSDCLIFHYPNSVRFFLYPQHIYYQPLINFTWTHAEGYLLGAVLAIWLELHGTICLHASTVVSGEMAISFLSNSGGGKTTMAMAMLQAGYSLLSDDILPIQSVGNKFIGHPAFPTMRISSEQAANFLNSSNSFNQLVPVISGSSKRLLPIGTGIFGQFCAEPVPLRTIYLLERNNTCKEEHFMEILPVAPSRAVIELIRYSFVARAAEGLNLSKSRLEFFSQFVNHVRIRRLVYSSNMDHLKNVREAIIKDLF